MNPKTSIILFGLVILLTACPQNPYQNNLKRIQNNGMDLPDLRKVYYSGIHYFISDLFEKDYADGHVLTDNAQLKVIHGLDLYFSVEVFVKEEADVIRFAFATELDNLNAIHDNYIAKREASLETSYTSIKKELPENIGFPGYIQVVHGSPDEFDDQSSYFTATVKIDDDYYVFQLIGKEANMGYLYDDFLDILASIEK